MQLKYIHSFWVFNICFWTCSLWVNGQSRDSVYVVESGIDFQMPNGFHSEDFSQELDRVFDCGDGKLSSSLSYMLANSDKTIRIGITVVKVLSAEVTKKINDNFVKGYNPNENYLRTVKNLADTTQFPVIFFRDIEKLRKYNADDGGVFIRKCNRPFLSSYKNHFILFLFKKDFGHVEITYFFNEDQRKEIEGMMAESFHMLRLRSSR
ncbi:hypothetical protein ACFQ4C_30495 [Larkinella insperata]|uniref:Uncharacterized protein n=1 Tax=Larkinella insperata TaxID=332158 RepID=A0ABW3QJZ2_9BACT